MSVKQYHTMENFEQGIATGGVTLVDFNAPWCAPCRSQEPIIEDLADRYKEKATIAAINIDNCPELASRLGIQSIPTLIVFKDQNEVQRFIGLQSDATLAAALDNALQ